MRFSRSRGGGVHATLAPYESAVLLQCALDLLELIEPATVSEDPLAAMLGLPDGEVPAPDDPVLMRLLPDAYRDDDESAGDFRRYTDADLRATKREHATVVSQTVPANGGKLSLTRDQVDAWLGCLNDMRLALGTALNVTEDTDPSSPDGDDTSSQALQVYGWLGFLQESLLSCIDPR